MSVTAIAAGARLVAPVEAGGAALVDAAVPQLLHGIPELVKGLLPRGIHQASWGEFVARFGGSDQRLTLLEHMQEALGALKQAGVEKVRIGGSFVSRKLEPSDIDAAVVIREGVVDMSPIDALLLVKNNATSSTRGGHALHLFREGQFDDWSPTEFLQYNSRDNTFAGVLELTL